MPSSVASRRKSIKATKAPPLAAILGQNRRLSSSSAAKTQPSQTKAVNKPDVFQFLQRGDSSSPSDPEHREEDKDDEEDETEDEDSDEDSDEEERTKPRVVKDLPSPVSSSYRASSPEQTFSIASRDSISTDPGLATPSESSSPSTAYLRLAHKHINHLRDNNSHSRGQRRRVSEDQQSDYAPEEYYIPSRRTSSAHDGAALVPTGRNKSKRIVSGYASLASKLDSSDKSISKLTPVYRRFENVNHRILLYLQDEISQMEEELQLMDEYDHEREEQEPASRRMDVEAARHFSGFHTRRTELLERLMYKTNQYSTPPFQCFPSFFYTPWLMHVIIDEALYTYTRISHALPKASPRDVHAYRAWIAENAPIAKDETAFLSRELDLVSLNGNIRGNGDSSVLYFIIGVMSAALLLPLLAY